MSFEKGKLAEWPLANYEAAYVPVRALVTTIVHTMCVKRNLSKTQMTVFATITAP